MKKLVLGAVLALAANAAMAGSLAEPVVEPEVVVQQAAASSVDQAILPPLLFVIFVGSAIFLG
jgi:hypothetical protein